MLFKSEQVRFVEIDQTLAAEADSGVYESAMNSPSSQSQAYDPFSDSGSGYQPYPDAGGEFSNTGF